VHINYCVHTICTQLNSKKVSISVEVSLIINVEITLQ
jgi:copper chaperone CopZ